MLRGVLPLFRFPVELAYTKRVSEDKTTYMMMQKHIANNHQIIIANGRLKSLTAMAIE